MQQRALRSKSTKNSSRSYPKTKIKPPVHYLDMTNRLRWSSNLPEYPPILSRWHYKYPCHIDQENKLGKYGNRHRNKRRPPQNEDGNDGGDQGDPKRRSEER